MNPFLLSQRELMASWKDLRKSLPLLSEQDQLAQVARFWAQAPLMRFAYDLETPERWTTPWEMMQANRWCRHSVAIGMEFTLRLAGWNPDRLRLTLICDYDLTDTFFVVEVDRHQWLNHEYGKVLVNSYSDYERLCEWTYSGRKYVEVPTDEYLLAVA